MKLFSLFNYMQYIYWYLLSDSLITESDVLYGIYVSHISPIISIYIYTSIYIRLFVVPHVQGYK